MQDKEPGVSVYNSSSGVTKEGCGGTPKFLINEYLLLFSVYESFVRGQFFVVQVTKSVIALLEYYRWFKFTIIFEETWETVAQSLKAQAKARNMTVNDMKSAVDRHKCCENRWSCCQSGYWYTFIQETKNRTRSKL